MFNIQLGQILFGFEPDDHRSMAVPDPLDFDIHPKYGFVPENPAVSIIIQHMRVDILYVWSYHLMQSYLGRFIPLQIYISIC